MLEELKVELQQGKKVYVFELISICLFVAFLGFGSSLLESILTATVANSILILWLIVNLIVITVYVLRSFISILLEEATIHTSVGKTILYKMLMFLIWFTVNGFIFLQGAGMAIPVITLGLTYLVLAYAKEIFPSKKGLMVAGIMWFCALFAILYFTYPLLFIVLGSIVPNVKLIELLINVLCIAVAILVYLQVIKKVTILNKKEHLA